MIVNDIACWINLSFGITNPDKKDSKKIMSLGLEIPTKNVFRAPVDEYTIESTSVFTLSL